MLPLFDTKSLGKFPFWIIVIILLNVYVFYLELNVPNIDVFISQYTLTPSGVNFRNLATLTPFVTSQFLHGGFLHIITNMLFLWVFGKNVEARIGFLFFPFIYILSGITGGLAQYAINPSSNIPMLGASGAISGILGAFIAFFPKHKIKTLVFIFIFITLLDIPAWILIFYWFITQLLNFSFSTISPLNQGGIAYIAHISGFMTGWIIAKIYDGDQKYTLA